MVAVAVTEPDFGSDVGASRPPRRRPTAPTASPAGGSTASRRGARSAREPMCSCSSLAPIPTAPKTHRGLSLFVVPKPRGEGHGFEFAQDGTRRQDRGPRDRHDRLPRHALLRGGARRLVGARRLPHRWRRRPRPRLLLSDGGLRERPAADGRARRRRDAGGVRGGRAVRARPLGVRASGRRLSSSPR